MGLLGLVGFALQCFVVLAWPLFALVYPLYSSIKAIETNSITDTHKINTYWVVFSLILLFEHAFMKLLEWFLLWPYIRLLIVFFLVMPHFDGALCVYKHLICPCLSINPQVVINLFNKRKESLERDNFLSEVERYVKENGPEGLEKFIACKSTRTNLNVKEFNAVSSMDNEASKSIKPNGGQKDIKAVQVMVKKKETTASQVGTVIEDPEPPKEVQKEWTCALSQVTTTCERNLNSHLQGRKHKAAYEALKAGNQAFVPKIAPASTAKTSNQPNKELGKSIPCSGSKQKVTVYENVQGQKNSSPAPITKKHYKPKEELADGVSSKDQKRKIAIQVEKVQSQQPKPNEVPRVKSCPWRCEICSVSCSDEIDLLSHLNGKKHKENVQEQQEYLIRVGEFDIYW
ncbi:uncharacterized protein LOC121049900 isoform X6 [Rosa chinensis]|uniref:uncharacterized protein LOC121049900 isoform X6 n=1 Tax=Rosa chinensis TaxID=74649 RepID=UPI001AD8B81D|nr:uncharacterized protein LOC121049900 isoform X6 [Rosa chinensis]